MSLGFIIIRHVNSPTTNLYWQEAYRCIRRFYTEPIIIIDDNSYKEFVTTDTSLVNCSYVEGEFPGRAELLPYYYFHKLHPFERAVIIHDSIFLTCKMDFLSDSPVEIFWTMDPGNGSYWRTDPTLEIIKQFRDADALIRFYQSFRWLGCFGVMSAVDWKFIDLIDRRYNFFEVMLRQIRTRQNRVSLERIWGCICWHHLGVVPVRYEDISFYCYYGLTWDEYKVLQQGRLILRQLMFDFRGYLPLGYLLFSNSEILELPMIKVWTGR